MTPTTHRVMVRFGSAKHDHVVVCVECQCAWASVSHKQTRRCRTVVSGTFPGAGRQEGSRWWIVFDDGRSFSVPQSCVTSLANVSTPSPNVRPLPLVPSKKGA